MKQLQAYLAKLRERLADEERPQEDAPLASNVLRLGRIRLLRQQIASCQQHVQELEGRGGTVGASGAGVVAPSLIGAGRAMNGPGRGATGVESGVNEVGRGVNGTGGGITGAGNNLNGSGAGSHIAGRGANGSGRGVNGAGRGLNGVGGGVYGAGGGVNGSGRGMNGAGRGVNEAGEGGDGGVTGTGEGVNEIGRGVNGGGQRVIRIRRGVNGAGRGQPAEADAGGGGGAVSSSVPGGSFDGVDLTRGTLNGLGEGKTIAMRMREVGLGVNRVTAPDAVRTGSAGVAETGAGRRSVNWNRVSGANANTSGEIGASKAKPPNLDVNERSAGATTRHGVNGASQGSAAVDNCLDCGRAVVPDVNRDHVDGATADGYSVNGDGGKGVVRLASVNRPGQGASTRERGGPIQIMPPVLPDSAGRRTPANPGGVVGAPNVPPANGGPQASVQRGARPLPKAVKVFRTVTMNGKAKTVEQVLTDPQQIAALYQRLEGRRAAGGAERSAREGTERGAAQRVEGQAGPPRDTEPGAAQRTGEAADSPQQMEARGEGTAMLRRDNKRKLSATGMDIGTTEELEGGRMGQPLAEGGVQGLQLLPRLESGPPEKKLKAQVEELSARLGGADAFANAPSKLGHTVGVSSSSLQSGRVSVRRLRDLDVVWRWKLAQGEESMI